MPPCFFSLQTRNDVCVFGQHQQLLLFARVAHLRIIQSAGSLVDTLRAPQGPVLIIQPLSAENIAVASWTRKTLTVARYVMLFPTFSFSAKAPKSRHSSAVGPFKPRSPYPTLIDSGVVLFVIYLLKSLYFDEKLRRRTLSFTPF
jgi:hypothetical protein